MRTLIKTLMISLFLCSLCFARSEVVSKRTYNSRTYKKGKTYTTEFHSGHIHYENGSGFDEIDFKLQWDTAKKGWYFNKHSFHPFIPEYADGWAEFRDVFKDKDQTLKIRAVCNHVKGRLITGEKFLNGAEGILYENAFGDGIDLIYCFERSALCKLIRFRTYPTQDSYYDFEIDLPPLKVYEDAKEINITKAVSFDKGKRLYIGGKKGTIIKEFHIWDSADGSEQKRDIVAVDYFIRDGKKFFRKNIPSSFFTVAQGDVFTDLKSSYSSAGGDGSVSYIGSSDWDTTHNATDGTGAATSTGSYGISVGTRHTGSAYRIYRGFVPIDTSGLPDNANISAASLNIYIDGVGETNGTQSYIVVVGETSQSSTTTLITDDYETCGTTHNPYEGSGHEDLTDIDASINSYHSWTLNSTGRGWINVSGVTKLGLRSGHDVDDIAVGASSIDRAEGTDSGGTSNTPYLEVTYTVPSQVILINQSLIPLFLIFILRKRIRL